MAFTLGFGTSSSSRGALAPGPVVDFLGPPDSTKPLEVHHLHLSMSVSHLVVGGAIGVIDQDPMPIHSNSFGVLHLQHQSISPWKLKTTILRGYVHFRECIPPVNPFGCWAHIFQDATYIIRCSVSRHGDKFSASAS